MYSGNYLFNTQGIRWAVDPIRLSVRVAEAGTSETDCDLAGLRFVLLTHAHADHVDAVLWRQLAQSGCHWVVPEHMADFFASEAHVSESARSVAVPGREMAVAGVRIVPFEAPHYEHRPTGETNHVDSTGYFVETGGRSYLLPGDIRTYDPECLKPFVDVSVVFAHVFLGRSAALLPDPPFLDAFVDFYLSRRPREIVLSHLYELARDSEDCWLASHAEMVEEAIHAADGRIEVVTPEWFRETVL
jgi:phosphoribosyl 1,2-cyclic phosphodiesterase